MAATCSDHHVAVFLQDDIGAIIKIQDGDGMELCRGATGFWNRFGVDEVNLEKKYKGQNKSTSTYRRLRILLGFGTELLYC